MRIRIGSVPYLNAKPLTYRLDRDGSVEFTLAVPRLLSGQLQSGQLSAALLSVVEAFRHEEYHYVPGMAIASHGKVASVLLFLNRPLSKVTTVGLDRNSLTSSLLTRLLCKKVWNITPEFREVSVLKEADLKQCDAVMVIGDKALELQGTARTLVDLGEEWTRWTGLPFVYALWLTREHPARSPLTARLQEAKRQGLANIDEIVRDEAKRGLFDTPTIKRYLTQNIHYELTPEHLASVKLFKKLLREERFLDATPPLQPSAEETP